MAKTVMTELGFTDIEAAPPKLKRGADPVPTSLDAPSASSPNADDISELSESTPVNGAAPIAAPAAPAPSPKVEEQQSQVDSVIAGRLAPLETDEDEHDEDEEDEEDEKADNTEDAQLDGLKGKQFNISPADDQRIHATVMREHALVWRTLRRFGVEHADADDATQLAFVAFSSRIRDVKVGRERSFLIGVCSRTAANYRRKAARRPEDCSECMDRTPDHRPNPEELFHLKEKRQTLERLLSHLPPKQREVFVLYELEGWTLPQIAECLTLRLGTCTSRLRRARDRAAQWVGDNK